MSPSALLLALHTGSAQAAPAARTPFLPPALRPVEAPEASAGGETAAPMQSAAALKAAVDRSHTAGRIGIITTYAGLGTTVLGVVAGMRGASRAATEGEAIEAGLTGLTMVFVGAVAFYGGTATLGGSSLNGALHLKQLAPTHSTVAGWISAGGLAAVVGGGLISLAGSPSSTNAGANLSGLGLLTALVSGHIQHARNRTRRASLAALHPRKPGPLAPTLADD